MKRFAWSTLLSLAAILAFLVSPALSASVVSAASNAPVIASAVVSPAQVSRPGFLLSALVREVAVKAGDRVQAGQTLVVLDTPELEYAVTAADAALRVAQLNAEFQRQDTVKVIRRGKTYFESLAPEVRQLAEVRVQQAQAALEIARANLAQGTLVAPYDATVAEIHVAPGEFVQLDQTVVTLAALDKLQIETTDLSERDIARIKIGQSASVFIEALNQEITATVIAISPRSETLGGDVVYKVTLAFEEIPDGLLWGMTAEVEIVTE
jgi:RND family efflux transporter MFP subunit